MRAMLRGLRGQRGNAAVEMALILPVLLAMLMGFIEIGNALRQYSSLVYASREGAREALRENSTANVASTVQNLLSTQLPSGASPTVTVTTGAMSNGQNFVTVQVSYAYKSFFSNPSDPNAVSLTQNLLQGLFGGTSPSITAQTTMPMQ